MSSENALGKADSSTDATDKEFSCRGCGKTLSQSASLYHVRNVCPSAGVECSKCDKLFSDESGMKRHHSREHGESIAGVLVECDYCGEETRQRPMRVENGMRNFCDKDCRDDWLRNDAPESHFQDRNRVTVECSYCGVEVERTPSYMDTREDTFCSEICHANFRSENVSGENHPLWQGGKVKRECEYCGDTVRRLESHLRGKTFCNHDCYGSWLSENKSGENSTRWKGGVSGEKRYYGYNWNRQKSKCLERDQYRCQSCYTAENDLQRKPDVHHIRPIKYYLDEYTGRERFDKANKLSNLICLCPSCHRKWEGIPLRPQ